MKTKVPLATRGYSRLKASTRSGTFMLDPESRTDAEAIRRSIRASTTSEAVRFAIRKMTEFMGHVKRGAEVVIRIKGKETLLDIPSLKEEQ